MFVADGKEHDERLIIKGFFAGGCLERYPECIKALSEYILNGSIVFDETRENGIDNFPKAMMDMLAGRNQGKMVVDLQ